MFAHKPPMLAAGLLILGLTSIGAGRWQPSAVADPAPASGAAKAPEPAAETTLAAQEKPRPGDRARQVRRQLSQYVTVEPMPAKTSLWTAVQLLSKKFDLVIDIDRKAFAASGVQNVEECSVGLPRMTNVRLSAVLRRLSRQVQAEDYTGAFLVRPDGIELTTTYQ